MVPYCQLQLGNQIVHMIKSHCSSPALFESERQNILRAEMYRSSRQASLWAPLLITPCIVYLLVQVHQSKRRSMGSREPRDVAAELKKGQGSHAEEDTPTKAPVETETDTKEKKALSSADAARITAASVLAEASETIDNIVSPLLPHYRASCKLVIPLIQCF